jgi:hypothetical protein
MSDDYDNNTATWCEDHALPRRDCPCGRPRQLWSYGDELQAAQFPPVEWHVRNLIPEGLTAVIGAPKVGKSWLVLDVAVSVAGGLDYMGEAIQPRPVLHVGLEDSPRRLQDRIRALGHDPIPRQYAYATTLGGLRFADLVDQYLNGLPDDAPSPLVIADTYGRVRDKRLPGESPYDYDYRVGARMKDVADSRPGMALVVVHHDRKAMSADFVDDVSGTNGLAGSMDTLLVVRRDRTAEDGVLLITGRDVTEAMYAATLDGCRWTLYGGTWEAASQEAHRVALATETATYGQSIQEIVTYVNGREMTRPADVERDLPQIGGNARQYLHRAHKGGLIDKAAHGQYTAITHNTEGDTPWTA